VLLHGPPGCSKTSLARAVATSSGANVIPMMANSLYSMCDARQLWLIAPE
jgi:SpoVK/Ycf46/Vps4 family AAA+-type ATPase